ncbi:MAG: hypothetical protein EP344_18890 [Bacteroidetes bacterium]|nr:MAG: hypothetical protein EP344_18890 [Bacteroidota bacterium]
MSSFFRKAISLFVILDEDEKPASEQTPTAQAQPDTSSEPVQVEKTETGEPPAMSKEDLSKFEQHFSRLFDQTNLPGPDYYEFWKTMDTLEAHIPDEVARINAVFASLKIQGLTKQILIESAGKYEEAILKDKANFESAVHKKSEAEIAGRQASIRQLEESRVEKQKMIQQLQQEIASAEEKIKALQGEIAEEKTKIDHAQRGYLAACTAMVSKIRSDVERFQQIIE